MNKSESKYLNTAILMNTALICILDKKDYEKITVKEICKKAGVNRSTFYLHYESINDLLLETIENLSKKFQNNFSAKPILNNKESAFLITKEYLVPYLNFVKENKKILKTIHNNPKLFHVEHEYSKMYAQIFYPAINLFNVKEKEKPYILEFFTKGVVAIINKWIERDCADPIDLIVKIIADCIDYE